MRLRTYSLFGLVVFSLAPNLACAQTFWTAGVDDWFTASNWNLGVPDAASGTTFDAVIANGGTALLQGPGGSVRRLRVGRSEGPGYLLIDGGVLTVTDDLLLNAGSTGTASVIVQGGSSVTAPTTVVGYSSDFATSFQIAGAGTVYNATGSFAVGRLGAGSASLSVEDSAVLTSGTGAIANVSGSTGGATVTGAGSKWSTTGTFTVGSAATGVLNIENQGLVYVGTALSIGNSSNVNLNGGTLRFNTITGLNRLNYTSGTIQLAGSRDFSTDATIATLFPSSTIPTGKRLVVEGSTTIQLATELVDGGELVSQGAFNVGSTFAGFLKVFNAGRVVTAGNAAIGTGAANSTGINLVNGAGSTWTVGGNLTIGNGDLTIQNQGLVYVGGAVNFTGGLAGYQIKLNGGTLRFSSYSDTSRLAYTAGTIQMSGDRTIGSDPTIAAFYGSQPTIPTAKQLTVEGTATIAAASQLTLTGGALNAETVLLSPGSRILNTLPSQANGAMLALSGSTIDATAGDLTLGDPAKVNGFYSSGTLLVGQRVVTLYDANDAVFDSAALVSIGSGTDPGTLAAANGLTLNFGGNIVGFGTIDTLDSSATPLINNGHITGLSPDTPIALTGYVKGVGTLDNVVITGTDAPGFSPATVVRGSVAYDGVLEVEIGGAAPGSFDQINHVLGAGLASLGGTLDIKLINGFSPTLGNSFEILTATGGVNGSFTTEQLPMLTAGLGWNVVYDANSVVLNVAAAVALPGDYNQNGTVDAADYTLWRDHLGQNYALTNENPAAATPGVVDAEDYAFWKSQFGAGGGSGASDSLRVAVPEPASLALLAMALVAIVVQRRPR